MKAGDIIEAIERFFLDIVGQVIPGFCLLIGFALLWPEAVTGIKTNDTIKMLGLAEPRSVVVIVLSYVIGHGVTSVGDTVIFPAIDFVVHSLRRMKVGFWIPSRIFPPAELSKKIQADPTFKLFRAEAATAIPSIRSSLAENMSISSWRNIAMSIAPEQRNTVYRFMFISLLNLGIATVLILIAIAWAVLAYLEHIKISTAHMGFSWLVWSLVFFGSLPFIERRYVFFRIANEVPFSIAFVTLWSKSQDRVFRKSETDTKSGVGSPLTIYLAGGFQSKWQDKVKEAVPGFRYLDPRSHRLTDKQQYTLWDLEAIRQSDWIFAHLEASNPGGYALAAEVGYGSALGKRIIFVNEKRENAEARRFFELISAACDVELPNLTEGIAFLEKLKSIVPTATKADSAHS